VLNRLFGVTLWCKTLVLRKDKVTHCLLLTDINSSLSHAHRPQIHLWHLLSWFPSVWRTKLRHTWATIVLRSPPSAADTYVQSTSISWEYRAVGELHSAIRLSLL